MGLIRNGGNDKGNVHSNHPLHPPHITVHRITSLLVLLCYIACCHYARYEGSGAVAAINHIPSCSGPGSAGNFPWAKHTAYLYSNSLRIESLESLFPSHSSGSPNIIIL